MDKPLLDVCDVIAMTGVSEATAYKIIREMNEELAQKGFYIVRGKVNSTYFKERFNLSGEYEKGDTEAIRSAIMEKRKERNAQKK